MEPPARMNNTRVAAILFEVAELLNVKGERFKPQAYAKVARAVESLPEDVAEVSGRGALEEIPGVGTHIAAKIREIVETGGLAYREKLRQELPEGVQELAVVEGIGPKRGAERVRKRKGAGEIIFPPFLSLSLTFRDGRCPRKWFVETFSASAPFFLWNGRHR